VQPKKHQDPVSAFPALGGIGHFEIPRRQEEAGKEKSHRCMGNEQAMVIRRAYWATDRNDHQRKLQVLQGGGQQQLPF